MFISARPAIEGVKRDTTPSKMPAIPAILEMLLGRESEKWCARSASVGLEDSAKRSSFVATNRQKDLIMSGNFTPAPYRLQLQNARLTPRLLFYSAVC